MISMGDADRQPCGCRAFTRTKWKSDVGRSSAAPAVGDRIVMRAHTSGDVDDGDGQDRQEPGRQARGYILAAVEGMAERAVVGIVAGRLVMLAGLCGLPHR